MSELLNVKKLCKNGILKKISFFVNTEDMVPIMGPSGSGKTHLAISGIRYGPGEIAALADGVCFSTNEYAEKSESDDNIMLPACRLNKGKVARKELEHRARMLMRKMGIEELAERRISEVSGGQLQRACICRSMMNQPKILFADKLPEPSIRARPRK